MENEYLEIRRQMKKYHNVQGLMRYINEDTLKRKHNELCRDKATGIDKVTKDEYELELERNIQDVLVKMKRFSYKPKAVRRVYIPKLNGKKRPLGIPSYEDKIVQGVMADILNEIYEPEFLECSYGFRPGRNCHQAIERIDKCVMNGKVNYIVEADIKGFFDNVDHKKLVEILEKVIKDKNFIRYVVRFLKAGVMEEMKVTYSEKGTPQGGLISPILANVYLHYALDEWFEEYVKPRCQGKCYLIRYVDDFVCCFEDENEAKYFYPVLVKRLEQYGLEVEESKTRVFPFGRNSKSKESFDFLGFTIYNAKSKSGGYRVGYKTNKKKSKEKKKKIKEYIQKNILKKPKAIIKGINRRLIGYDNYYGISFNYKWLKEIHDYAERELHKWLSRRSQNGKITWERMKAIIKYNPIVRPKITYKLW